MSAPPPAGAPFEALAACGEHLLLIGGNAMIGYGSQRATFDCDCAVTVENERLVAAVLAPLGYLFKERYSSFSRYAHLAGERPVVDVMLLDRQSFQSLRAECCEVVLKGVRLHAPKPLHLAALKLHALKQNPRRLGKDWQDIEFLLQEREWTREELQALADRYASAESLAMLRTAGFL